MADERIVISSGPGLSPDEVGRRTFASSWRGFDQAEVRLFLDRVREELEAGRERERQLRKALEDALARADHPELDEATLTTALGDQAARILRSAREAAADVKGRAEEQASRLLKDASDEATRLRLEAENALARRVEDAERVAGSLHDQAVAEAAELRSDA